VVGLVFVTFGALLVATRPTPVGAAQGQTATWTKQNPLNNPGKHFGANMVYDAARGNVVLYGGSWASRPENYFTTWTWDGQDWKRRDTNSFPQRSFPGMAYDAERKQVVLFGGGACQAARPPVVVNGAPENDLGIGPDPCDKDKGATWIWDGNSWTAKHPAVSPPDRWYPNMAYDPISKEVVMVGGSTTTTNTDSSAWTWNGSNWAEHPQPDGGPSNTTVTDRDDAVMDFDGRRLMMWGGGGQYAGDRRNRDYGLVDSKTWFWDGSTFTPMDRTPTPQPVRFDAGGKFNGENVVFYGGRTQGGPPGSGEGPYNDTWMWNGICERWLRAPVGTQPGNRLIKNAMTIDGTQGKKGTIMMYGGGDGGYLDDTWTLGPPPGPVSTSTVVGSSLNPSQARQPVTFTATVGALCDGDSKPVNPAPTGKVSFTSDGVAIGQVDLSGGVASLTTNKLPVGDHLIQASYDGAPGFPASLATLTQKVLEGPPLGISIGNITVGEGTSPALIPITLTSAAVSDVVVNFATHDATATSPEDYSGKTGTVTIPQDKLTGVISVPIIDDTEPERTETFVATLTGSVGAKILTATGTVTILDNDSAAALPAADESRAFGHTDIGTGNAPTTPQGPTQPAQPPQSPVSQVHTSSAPAAQAQTQAQHQVQAQQQIQAQQQVVVQHAQAPVVQAQTVVQPQPAMSTEAQIQRKVQAERIGGKGPTQVFLATSRAGTATAGPAMGVGAILTLLMMVAVTPSKRRKHERATAFSNTTLRFEADSTRRCRSQLKRTRGR